MFGPKRRCRLGAVLSMWAGLSVTLGCEAGDAGSRVVDPPADGQVDVLPGDVGADVGDATPPSDSGCAPLAAPPRPPRDLPCAEGDCGSDWPNLGAAPCPSGWRLEALPEVRGHVCWPPPLAIDCARPDAHGACADDCTAQPAPEAVHVAPGGPDGDGRADRPRSDLVAALAAAGRGQTVYLLPGTYAGGFDVPRDVTLRGGCAGDVVLTGPADRSAVRLAPGAVLTRVTVRSDSLAVDVPPAIDAADPPAVIDDVVVADSPFGLRVQAPLRARRVVVERIGEIAINVGDATLTAEDVVLRDTGIGLRVQFGRASLRDARFERIATLGVFATAGAAVTLDRVALHEVGAGAAPEATMGVLAFDARTTLTVDHLTIERTVGPGLVVGRGAVLGGRDVAMRAIGARGATIRALATQSGGVIDVQRAYLAAVVGSAITSTDAGSRTVLRDVLVTDVSAGGVPGTGVAAWANHGGAVEIVRGRLARFAQGGALASEDATLALDGVVIGPAAADAPNGTGVSGQPGGRITIERSVVSEVRTFGVWLAGTPSTRLADVRVADVRPHGGSGQLGVGLLATDRAAVELERVRFERVHRGGLHLRDAHLTAHDLDVETVDTGRAPADDSSAAELGVGLTLAGSLADLRRVRLSGSRGQGVAILAASELNAADLTVRGTRSAPCAAEDCPRLAGDGVAVGPHGAATLERVELDDYAGVGVWRACDAAGLTVDGARFTTGDVARATDGECAWADAAEGLCGDTADVVERRSALLPSARLLEPTP